MNARTMKVVLFAFEMDTALSRQRARLHRGASQRWLGLSELQSGVHKFGWHRPTDRANDQRFLDSLRSDIDETSAAVAKCASAGDVERVRTQLVEVAASAAAWAQAIEERRAGGQVEGGEAA